MAAKIGAAILAVAAFVAFMVLFVVVCNQVDHRRDLDRNRRNQLETQRCIDGHGVVHTDRYGWFSGCEYRVQS